MAKTCSSCKYWEVEYMNVCDRIKIGNKPFKATNAFIDVSVDNDTGLGGYFVTSSQFSCKFFKPKE